MIHYCIYQGKKVEYIKLESNTPFQKILLFLHGINDPFQNHTNLFNNFVNAGYKVFALNLPYHGKSDGFEEISWELLSEIVNSFIESNNLENITLIGYSLGGTVALDLIGRNPAIKQVSLISPYCEPLNYFSIKFIYRSGLFTYRNLHEILAKKYNKPTPYMTNMFKIFLKYAKLFTQKQNFNLKEFKGNINVVVLGKDEMIDADKVQRFFKDYSNVRVSILDNFTHNIYFINDQQAQILTSLLV